MLASTIVFARVIFEVAIVAPTILLQLVPPLAVMMVLMMLVSAAMYVVVGKGAQEAPLEEDPSDLKSALLFGILYAAVIFAVAVAKEHSGDEEPAPLICLTATAKPGVIRDIVARGAGRVRPACRFLGVCHGLSGGLGGALLRDGHYSCGRL